MTTRHLHFRLRATQIKARSEMRAVLAAGSAGPFPFLGLLAEALRFSYLNLAAR